MSTKTKKSVAGRIPPSSRNQVMSRRRVKQRNHANLNRQALSTRGGSCRRRRDAMPGLAADVCFICGAPADNKCSRCKSFKYCSTECQKEHWICGHNLKCKQGSEALSLPRRNSHSCPDCFNKLPSDIIIDHILTLLDLKERMRSSLLSRRWRNLWRHTLGGNLVFPHGLDAWQCTFHPGETLFSSFLGCHSDCPHVKKNLIPYINWVDSTLRHFAGTELDCFSVCYELDSRFSPVVHRWLVRAIRLGVKKLHLHLGPFRERTPVNNCEFPSVDKLSRLFHVDLNAYPGCTLGISYLKELSLEFVNISGQTVQYLLFSCPLLEFMSLKKATCRYLRIAGPSLKLKYLHVLGCFPLEKLDISAPNLIALKYDGSKEALFFTSIPRLEYLGMFGTYFKQFCDILWQRPWPHFGDFFCQLKSLEFEMTYWEVEQSASFPLELPMLVNLEEVKVKIDSSPHLVFLWPCCLLKSAPRLKRFAVEHKGIETGFPSLDEETYKLITKTMTEATKCKHPCLKVVEYVGFGGRRSERVLVQHLLLCAKSPEKVVFDTGGKPEVIQRYLRMYKLRCAEVVVL